MARRKRLSPADPEVLMANPGLLDVNSIPIGQIPEHVRKRLAKSKSAPIAGVAQESAAAAALEEVSDTLSAARESGRMVLELPLDAVYDAYLVRDRTKVDADEMAMLRDSIATRGQQTPIEVVELAKNHYGLISGWRRLTALRQLCAEGDGTQFTTVLALLRRPEDSAEAYLSMVEENELRVGLSYYERARIAMRAVDKGVFETEKKALLSLFRSASRAKRSKIRSFLTVVRALDPVLRFPEDIPERLGLQLAQALEANPNHVCHYRDGLREKKPQTAEAEKACLQNLLKTWAKRRRRTKPDRPRDGLTVERSGPSRVVLSGPAVDDQLYDRLLTFLAQSE